MRKLTGQDSEEEKYNQNDGKIIYAGNGYNMMEKYVGRRDIL